MKKQSVDQLFFQLLWKFNITKDCPVRDSLNCSIEDDEQHRM